MSDKKRSSSKSQKKDVPKASKPKKKEEVKPKKEPKKEEVKQKKELQDMYCGLNEVPKGKKRGSPEYCLNTKQVRYYGAVALDKKLLEGKVTVISDLVKEKLKLRKLEDKAKILIKEALKIKAILNDPKTSEKKLKGAEKKRKDLIDKKNDLVKKMTKQEKHVKQLEKSGKKSKK